MISPDMDIGCADCILGYGQFVFACKVAAVPPALRASLPNLAQRDNNWERENY